MLQQTRVETVLPHYRRWMRRFPNLRVLAAASEQDVLLQWEGLGYYARARNLRKAARAILSDYGGELPSQPDRLRALPGIGRYTAAAIASIAFDLDEPTLEANIRRVLSRAFNVSRAADSAQGERVLWELAAANLPRGSAGKYNQALMDLGALVCLPAKPRCSICPVAHSCEAHRLGLELERPVLKAKKRRPHSGFSTAVVARRGRVLLGRRSSSALLGGMWEFPSVKLSAPPRARSQSSARFALALEEQYGLKVLPERFLGTIQHAYTHFHVTVSAFSCKLIGPSGDRRLRWIRISELRHYPMGKIDRQIAGKIAA